MNDLINVLLLGHHSRSLRSIDVSSKSVAIGLVDVRAEQQRVLEVIAGDSDSVIVEIRKAAHQNAAVAALSTTMLATELQNQNEVVSRAAQALEEPRRTQSNELLRSGAAAVERGRATNDARWFEDAIKDLNEAVEIDRYNFQAYFLLGEVHTFHLLDREHAEDSYANAAHYAWPDDPPTSALALLGLSWWASAFGDRKRSVDLAEAAIERDPGLGVARLRFATGLAASEADLIPVRDACREAIAINPRLVEVLAADPAISQYEGVLDEYITRSIASITEAKHCVAALRETLERAASDVARYDLLSLRPGLAASERLDHDRESAKAIVDGTAAAVVHRLDAAIPQGSAAALAEFPFEAQRLRAILGMTIRGLILELSWAIRKETSEEARGDFWGGDAEKVPPLASFIGWAVGAFFAVLILGWIGYTLLAVLPGLGLGHAGPLALVTAVAIVLWLVFTYVRRRELCRAAIERRAGLEAEADSWWNIVTLDQVGAAGQEHQ